jgi:copper(I)-binding protein
MTRHSLVPSVVAAVLLASPVPGIAHAYDAGALHIGHPWVKAPPNAAPTAGGYLTVTNRGKTADRLLGGSSPALQAVQPHSMSMAGGVMRMRALPKGWEIAPGATLTLAPGGDHLMLIGPRRPLKIGDHIPATLNFEHAGPVKVDFIVQAEAPAAGMSTMKGMDMR